MVGVDRAVWSYQKLFLSGIRQRQSEDSFEKIPGQEKKAKALDDIFLYYIISYYTNTCPPLANKSPMSPIYTNYFELSTSRVMMCGLIECFVKKIGDDKGHLQEKYAQSSKGLSLTKASLEKTFLAYI